MNKLYHSLYRRLGSALLLLITAFIVHSCRKNSTADDKQITPNVMAAKTWYENTYKQPTAAILKNMGAAGQATNGDFSQLAKPDWSKAAFYQRLGSDVLEVPLDSAVKLGFTPQQTNPGQFDINKSFSKTSFLIFSNNGVYKAYLMAIIADTPYLQNDFTKLANLSYRHKDKDFSGSVLYFTPEGKLVNGWYYKNGKIKRSIASSTGNGNNKLQVQSATKLKVFGNGCTISYYYVYAGKSCIGGGDTNYCTYYYDLYTTITCDEEGHQPGGDDGGDGGFATPGTTVTQVTVVTSTPIDSTVLKLMKDTSSLTKVQKHIVDSLLKKIIQDCLGKALYDAFANHQPPIQFNINISSSIPNNASAAYVPSTSEIRLRNTTDLTSGALEEELFHAFQNNFGTTGGTAQYSGANHANIEFEAFVLLNMNGAISTGGSFNLSNLGTDFFNWMYDVTNSFTSYPTSFTSSQMSSYTSFLAQWSLGAGLGSTVGSLQPQALFALSNISPCSTH